jgi:hypothetical protein
MSKRGFPYTNPLVARIFCNAWEDPEASNLYAVLRPWSRLQYSVFAREG